MQQLFSRKSFSDFLFDFYFILIVIVKKNTKSKPAEPLKTVAENKTEPVAPPAIKQTAATLSKISTPNLLQSYPGSEKKSKKWILILVIFVALIISGFFIFNSGASKDTDKDGIADAKDKYPDVIGLAIYNGCPDPGDGDGDGVPDSTDGCPGIAGEPSANGCPDADRDSIADKVDKCKDIVGLARYGGCPIPDTDGDEVNDEIDKCKNIAGDVRYGGCPIPDTDGDGLNDEIDKCKTEKGPKENDGCPVKDKSKEPIPAPPRPIKKEDVINDAKNEKINCQGEIFNNGKGQDMDFQLQRPKDQEKLQNITLKVKITFLNGCVKYFTFYYENTGNGFKYINKF